MRIAHALVALFSLLSLPAAAAITGVVIDERGAAIAGANVEAFHREEGAAKVARWMSGIRGPAAFATAVSGTDGRFMLDVQEEVVDLRVSAAGRTPVREAAMADEDLGAILLPKADPVEITLTGDGTPVAGAIVIADDEISRSDEQGHFTIDRSTIRLTILAEGFTPTRIVYTGHNPVFNKVVLRKGRTLRGRVLRSGDKPVAGAEVFVDDLQKTTTGEDGWFVIDHVPDDAEVRAYHGELAAFARTLVEQESLTLRLRRPTQFIGGALLDSATCEPIADALVRVYPDAVAQTAHSMTVAALTDSRGAFRLPELRPGSWRVLISRPGYQILDVYTELVAGKPVELDLSFVKSGVVTGSVTDSAGRGIGGIRIWMSPEDRRSPPAYRTRYPRAHSTPEGSFVLRTVPPSHNLVVKAGADAAWMPEAASEPLRLSAGETRSGITIVIPRITLEGRVVDRDGTPVAGAKIRSAKSEADMDGAKPVRRITMDAADAAQSITGADGAFRLPLPAGRWDFTVWREGYATRVHRAIDVRPGVEPVTLTLDEGFTLTGRVVRKDGTGVPDVNVNLLPVERVARTGGDGSFAFPDLERGPVNLMATKVEEFIFERRNAEVPSPELVIELPATGTIRGRVIERGSKSPVTDFLAGLSGERRSQGVMIRSLPFLRPFRADDGTFELKNVPAGTQELLVQAAGYIDARVPNLEVEEGKVLRDVEILLDPGATVTGRVLGPDGTPAADAKVTRLPLQEERRMPMARSADGSTTTDAEGRFAIKGLAEGEHVFRASKSGLVSDEKAMKVSGKEASIELRLSVSDTLAGQLVTESGAPVADAEVSAMNASNSWRAKSDAGGAFRLEGLAPGPYVVRVSREGYVTAERHVDVGSGALVRIVLSSGGTITGRIFGLSESELASITIAAMAANGGALGNVSRDGSFRIEGVPVGVVQVNAYVNTPHGSQRGAVPKTVEVPAGGIVRVDLEFSAGSTERGRVRRY